jgi:hypothetical protein
MTFYSHVNDRIVLPELLDVLPPRDSAALRSRRDLRRLNAWMRHPQIMARALRENLAGHNAPQIVELGAGDGHFLLSVAERLNGFLREPEGVLVDRLETTEPQIYGGFQGLGWRVRTETAEAADWLRNRQPAPSETVVSNLFFHQFKREQLAEMLRLAAKSAHLVIALEPRRAWLPKIGGRLLWVIGCGSVTRHDAHISIRAGFYGTELSALWPDKENWQLTEQPAGLFSHLFIARRKD